MSMPLHAPVPRQVVPNSRSAHLLRSAHACVIIALVALAGCATSPLPASATDGMPLDAFLDDLKVQLREVHWHVRGSVSGCGDDALREVDLRDGQVLLSLERVAQVDVGGSVKLVAVPLGALLLGPTVGADYTRKAGQQLTLKLAVSGPTARVDIDHAPQATTPVAQALNAAIDGFVRSDNAAPCLQMTALKLELVVDVKRSADGGFKVVVPAVAVDASSSTRNVNTLTLNWERIASNRVR